MDDGYVDPTLIIGSTTISLGESIEIGTVYYTPTDGMIEVAGSIISVVSVTVTTIITIDGSPATVYPAKSLVMPVYNWTALGFASSPTGRSKGLTNTATKISTELLVSSETITTTVTNKMVAGYLSIAAGYFI